MKIIYKMSHPKFKKFIYIGSTQNLEKRIEWHRQDCFNKNSSGYNTKIYKFIKENNINFNEIEFEMICEATENVLKTEAYFIKKFDSIKNGLNTKLPWIKKIEKPQEFRCPHCNIRFSQDIYLQNHINQFHNH